MDLIATIGPSSWHPETIAAHVRLGLRGIRFPFSKLRPEDHVERCHLVRDVATRHGTPVQTMADLPGGKPRLNAADPVPVRTDREYRIAFDRSGPGEFWLDPGLSPGGLQPGDHVLIGDGENRFVVDRVSCGTIAGRFTARGVIEWRRAFIPLGKPLAVVSFTRRDRELAAVARAAPFDWLALSYVQSADDVDEARAWLRERLDWRPRLVAKIETAPAVERAEAIARSADAVMIGRGDLAPQIGFEALWAAQRAVVGACARAGTYCIAATGFLESMAANASPTRAECVDFCATLAMGVDAVLFSTETSIGCNPTAVLETAVRLRDGWSRETAIAG